MIEDLAEWMEEAFTKYNPSPADSGASDQTLTIRVPSPKSMQAAGPSPLASASEGETDSPITFVPKKQARREAVGQPSTRVQALQSRGDSSASGSDTVVSSASASSETHKVAAKGTAGSGAPEKAGTARLGGQVITEEELMRRRRLLDSYILD